MRGSALGLTALALLAAACGPRPTEDAGTPPYDAGPLGDAGPSNPVPELTALSPSTVAQLSADTVLTATGSQLVPGASLLLDGTALTVTSSSATSVTATVPADRLTLPGVHEVRAVNPAPGGGTSRAQLFTVSQGRVVPVLVSLSPDRASAGGAGFMLTVNGASFATDSVVRWNGAARATTRVTSGRLTASIQASDVGTMGSAQVTAFTPDAGESNALTFTLTPASTQSRFLVAVSSDGDGGIGDAASSAPAMSPDGRFIAFISSASNLTDAGGGTAYVFLRDTCRGAAGSCSPSTQLVSLGMGGALPDRGCRSPAVSDDGRFVLYVSGATNIVPNDSNNVDDTFVVDTCLGATGGCVPGTVAVATTDAGTTGPNYAREAALSSSGRYVAWLQSGALVPEDTNGYEDIYLSDTCLGASACTPWVRQVPFTRDGGQVRERTGNAFLSHNARWLTYGTFYGPGLGLATFGQWNVFRYDTCIGAGGACVPSIEDVVVALDAGFSARGCAEYQAPVSDDGRFIVMTCSGTDLAVNKTSTRNDVFLRDTCLGASSCTPSTRLLSVALGGQGGSSDSRAPQVTIDFSRVVFASSANDLTGNDTNNAADVFLRDTCAGVTSCSDSITRVGLPLDGGESSGAASTSNPPRVSADAQVCAFESSAPNLVENDTNGVSDVFYGTCQ